MSTFTFKSGAGDKPAADISAPLLGSSLPACQARATSFLRRERLRQVDCESHVTGILPGQTWGMGLDSENVQAIADAVEIRFSSEPRFFTALGLLRA